jgi:hypothetical protein
LSFPKALKNQTDGISLPKQTVSKTGYLQAMNNLKGCITINSFDLTGGGDRIDLALDASIKNVSR